MLPIEAPSDFPRRELFYLALEDLIIGAEIFTPLSIDFFSKTTKEADSLALIS